jgi:CheY-like chemotaxis protein
MHGAERRPFQGTRPCLVVPRGGRLFLRTTPHPTVPARIGYGHAPPVRQLHGVQIGGPEMAAATCAATATWACERTLRNSLTVRGVTLQPLHWPKGGAMAGDKSVLNGKRVVIVEDEGLTQMQIRKALSRMGVDVLADARTGEQGVEVVLRERPDLVLMDVHMPGGMDGIAAAETILAQFPVCVVLLTAYDDEQYKQRAARLPACAYVVKPVTMEMLVPLLEQALNKWQACGR